MDFAVSDGVVEMVVYGSGVHVDSVAIHTITEIPGPFNYTLQYYATTGPNKSNTIICGGSGTGASCYQKFTINATYKEGVGIRSCGSITRVEDNENMGTACKDW